MVAGGGGGGSGGSGIGGSGGGNSGGYGQRYSTSTATSPGTQTSGYTLGRGGTGTYGGTNATGTGGGGGGYYGGYGAGDGPKSAKPQSRYGVGGGGGSGYVNTDIFRNSSMSNGARSGSGQIKITPVS